MMSDREIRKAMHDELSNIVPEIDFVKVGNNDDLREALDINSMDFLNFITAIHHCLGVDDIPEIDYPKLVTIGGAVSYLASQLVLRRKQP